MKILLKRTLIWSIPGLLLLIPILLYLLVMLMAEAVGTTDGLEKYKKLPDGIRSSLGPLLFLLSMALLVYLIKSGVEFTSESIYFWGFALLLLAGGISISRHELKLIRGRNN